MENQVVIYKAKKIKENGYKGVEISYAIKLGVNTVSTEKKYQVWNKEDKIEAIKEFLQNHEYIELK